MGLGLRTRRRQGRSLLPTLHPVSPARCCHMAVLSTVRPRGALLTAAFIPPTTAPGPSGTPSLLHKPTTAALGPALPCLLPQPGPAQTFRRSPVPTWCTLAGITGHPRTERGPGLRVSPGSLPKPSQWTRSPPLVPTRHRGGGAPTQDLLLWVFAASFSG